VRLTCVVRDAQGERQVEVDEQGAAVADLVDALRGPDGGQVTLLRTRAPLPPHLPLARCGLRHGDTVVVTPHGMPAPAPGLVDVVVVHGPDTGRLVQLPVGEHVLGRDPACALPLTDPDVSRAHACLTVSASGVSVRDVGSHNGTRLWDRGTGTAADLDGSLLALPAYLDLGGTTRVLVAPPPTERAELASRGDGTLAYNRPPRHLPAPPAQQLEVPAPPEPPRPQRLPMVGALLPVAAALLLYAFVRQPVVLAMAALSPVMAIGSWWESRRGGRSEHAEQERRAAREAADAAARLRASAAAELAWLEAMFPGPGVSVRRAVRTPPDLWAARPGDPDFGTLRVGAGDRESTSSVRLADGGDPAARDRTQAVLAGSGRMGDAPATADLLTSGGLGIAGPGAADVLRATVLQAVTAHSPADLRLTVVTSDEARWAWTRWLPHTDTVTGRAGAAAAVAALRATAQGRTSATPGGRATALPLPLHLLVVDDVQLVEPAWLAELGPSDATGVCFAVAGDVPAALPGAAGAVLDTRTGVLTGRRTGGPGRGRAEVVAERHEGVRPDTATPAGCEQAARTLAALRDAVGRETGGSLPTQLGLLELLGTDITDPAGLAARWERGEPRVTALLGTSEAGPLRLTLSGDTSHALVGGTTGSGKSELLQTYVAALAAEHPPEQVTFILVDYKGGAAFKDCVDLPHVVGFVTDLDSALVSRALVSLRAEVHRRERLISAAGATSLDDMVARRLSPRPAYLLLVVDEFATLAKELPEFVDGVLDVAQRGRSLGLHLVLATQRPAGSITDAIRTNVPVRVALRLNDDADSADVIGSADAARIRRGLPGRGYMRTSSTELTAFQAAYAGSRSTGGAAAGPAGLSVRAVGRALADVTGATTGFVAEAAEPVLAQVSARLVPATEEPTDLQRLVSAARAAVTATGRPAPPLPWLPDLPALLPWQPQPHAPGVAVLGLLDEPEHQRQVPWGFDLERDGSLLVVGMSGSGKSTALRTLAAELASSLPPDRLWLYGLDFGSRGLTPVAALPHTGAVVPAADVDRVERLLLRLRTEVTARQDAFASTGAGSLSEHERAGGTPLPRIVVLLDNLAGFRAAFDELDYGRHVEELPRLVSDGRGAGIHFAISADRRAALTSALAQVLPTRLVLPVAEADEYGALGLVAREVVKSTPRPGGGFLAPARRVQLAVLTPDGAAASGDVQAAALTALGARLRAQYPSAEVPSVGQLPPTAARGTEPPAGTGVEIGVSGTTLEPLALEPADGHWVVAGPTRSGRSTALVAFAEGAAAPRRVLLAPRRSAAAAWPGWDAVSVGAAVEEACEALEQEVRSLPGTADSPVLLVCVDDADELGASAADDALAAVAKLGRERGVWVVAATTPDAVRRAYGGVLAELRKDRTLLLLQPDASADADLVGRKLPRRTAAALPGRGLVCRPSSVEPVQLFLPAT
jgi:DNA segregation ATPase FtsK/SpoIIIE, S-DNA-T family